MLWLYLSKLTCNSDENMDVSIGTEFELKSFLLKSHNQEQFIEKQSYFHSITAASEKHGCISQASIFFPL